MNIFFVEVTRDFTATTPLTQPLGGTQSAICYLARELVDAGHAVTVINGVAQAQSEDGIRFLPWQQYPWDGITAADAVIIVSANAEMISGWQALHGKTVPWLQWVTHDVDQPAVSHLKNPAVHEALDGFLFVSEWQAQCFRQTFGIPWDRITVFRNAAGPAFQALFPPGTAILPAKSADPLLVFTSTPFRGLEVLLDAVPLIRQRVPQARFKIFSSWKVYNLDDSGSEDLYRRCRETAGVEYVGNVGQQQLAEELKAAWCLAYPSTFNETSCISVMEAFAAGCKVVTTHRGAMPETTAGLARLVINPRDRGDLVRRFASATSEVLEAFRADPERTEAELEAGVAYARQYYSWHDRAAQLVEVLNGRWAAFRPPVVAAAVAPEPTPAPAAPEPPPSANPEDVAGEQFADDLARIDSTGSLEALQAFIRLRNPNSNQMVFAAYRLMLRGRFSAAYLLGKRLRETGLGHPLIPLAESLGGLLTGQAEDERAGTADLARQVDLLAPQNQTVFYLQVVQPVGRFLLQSVDPEMAPRLRKILQAGAPQFRGQDSFDLV